MSKHVVIAVSCLAISLMAISACGDDVSSADAQRYCKALCNKTKSCTPSGFGGAIDCDAQCSKTGSGGGSSSTCNASKSNIDACVSGYEAMSCADLQSGKSPAACSVCSGSSTAEVISDTSGAPDVSSGTGTCDDLSDCCAQLADANQKASCEQAATVGTDSYCSSALAGYKLAGFCN